MSNPASTPIQQNAQTNNAKYVSIIPENGTEFKPNQKMTFNIDPSIGWVKGRDSYLVFDIENTATSPIKLSLRKGGISSIIKQVNIFSAQNGMLLETLDDYNKWSALELEYKHDDTTNLVNVEGCMRHQESKCGLAPHATDVKLYQNLKNNMNQPESHRLTPQDNTANPMVSAVRFCAPLKCGVFRWWDDETLVPILQMGGLRVELVLAPAIEVLDMPYLHAGGDSSAVSSLLPLGSDAGNLLKVVCKDADTADFKITITDTNINIDNCGLLVGNAIKIQGDNAGSNVVILKTITSIATSVTTEVELNFTGALGTTITDVWVEIDTSADALTPLLDYTIRSAEFRLLQEMPPNTQLQNLDYVFTSYDCFRDTIPQTQTSFNQDISSVASKAVSIFTSYEDNQYDATINFPNNQYYQGLAPDETGVNMNSVVYFINNKLYPLRAYNPQRYGDKVINQNELVKAFGSININVKHLGSSEGADLGQYTNRYLHARELARGASVFNLQNAEPQIRIGFSDGRGEDKYANQIANIRMLSWVFSKKILHIDGDTGLSLEH